MKQALQDSKCTSLTSFWAETICCVSVIILGCGTPTVTIIPALSGTAVILFPLKGEGELTRSSLCISTQSE